MTPVAYCTYTERVRVESTESVASYLLSFGLYWPALALDSAVATFLLRDADHHHQFSILSWNRMNLSARNFPADLAVYLPAHPPIYRRPQSTLTSCRQPATNEAITTAIKHKT